MHSRELPFLMVAAPQPSSPGMLSPMRLGKSVCLPPIWVRAGFPVPHPTNLWVFPSPELSGDCHYWGPSNH
jgi:hypothetical protein